MIYIGAGLHLQPLVDFGLTKEFIFVDVQPRTESVIYRTDSFGSDNYEYWGELMYRKKFYSQLISRALEYNFVLEKTEELEPDYFQSIMTMNQRIKWLNNVKQEFPNICPTLLTFYNYQTGQKLKYYISTNILKNVGWDLENDFSSSDGLVISGYHPDIKILEYIKNPINLYCYIGTSYSVDEDDFINEPNNLIYWIFSNIEIISKYFSSYYVVDKSNGMITQFDDFTQINGIIEKIEKK